MHYFTNIPADFNSSEDLVSLNVPECIIINDKSNFIIKQANPLFINLLQRKPEDIMGSPIGDVFPNSLEFKYYPHINSLLEGIKESWLTKKNIQVTPEHYVLIINNSEVFEINKWALTITPSLNDKLEVEFLKVTVLEAA